MPNDVLRLVSALGELDFQSTAVAEMIQQVKTALKDETYGASMLASIAANPWIRPPRMDEHLPEVGDPYDGGVRWIQDLQTLARRQGNPWVPWESHDLLGVDLGGIWRDSLDDADRTYIRQFGPYLNVIMGIGGEPRLLAEGLYDPFHSRIAFVGSTLIGNACAGWAQLQRHWILDGEIETSGFFGAPEGRLFVLEKIG
jgi:hypothetical protein